MENNVNLEDEVVVHIDGDQTKDHKIQWDVFKNIGDKLQQFISNIAKYDTETKDPIDDSRFKLDLVGLYSASFGAGFAFNQSGHYPMYDIDSQKKKVSERFNELMQVADSGNYVSLLNSIKLPEVREKVVSSLYEFTESFKGMPVSIGKRDKDGITNVYKIKKFTAAQKSYILPAIHKKDEPVSETTTQVAKISVTRTRGKNTKTKVSEIYNLSGTDVSFSTDYINTSERIYTLWHPLYFKIEKEGQHFLIENESLLLYAEGESERDAQNNIFTEFDETYRRVTGLPDEQLGPRMLRAKKQFQLIVKDVKTK